MAKKSSHSDMSKDKAQIKKAVGKHETAMHPGEPKTKLKAGGKVPHMTGGAGGGVGRLQKAGMALKKR